MRVAINTRFLLPNKLEGFGWYTYEVVSRLIENNPECEFVLFFDRPVDAKFQFKGKVKNVVLSPPARHPLLFFIWFEWSVRRALKKYNIDVFLSPDGYLSLFTKVPQINVIHDIGFEHYPKDLPWLASKYLRFFFPRFAKKSQKIITVSSATKNDIIAKYNISPKKIKVAWNGVSSMYKPFVQSEKQHFYSEHTSSLPYFLFVGSIHPRKNVQRLVDAYSLFIKETNSKFPLIIIGSNMWKGNAISIPENVSSSVRFTGHLSSQMLSKYMACAFALVYVPYFEGFGLPLVEAMACGIPIISGDKTSLPEVAGDAAIYCNPFDVLEIKNQMVILYSDKQLQKQLSINGLERKKVFSWDQTASLVWEEVLSCCSIKK